MYWTRRPLARPLTTWMVTLRWHPTANQIDLVQSSGPTGQFLKGIYERSGDRLRLCVDMTGDSRPEKSDPFLGNKSLVMVLKREE